MKFTLLVTTMLVLAGCGSAEQVSASPTSASTASQPMRNSSMELGNFSVSLAVKDIKASRAFYEKLGFTTFGGDEEQNWLIMQNGTATIGLFQGMFDKNILTFNPGWDRNAQNLESFTDVRDLQKELKAKEINFATEADESSTGPASFVIVDPDGNQILVDQHR
jgi:catechol 2,3-dioxygenase-like lactoylglutathione lyase family enzyme